MAPVLESVLTCPPCGRRSVEQMPMDRCAWHFEFPACHIALRPKAGDGGMFFPHGPVPCPPVQLSGGRAGCCA